MVLAKLCGLVSEEFHGFLFSPYQNTPLVLGVDARALAT